MKQIGDWGAGATPSRSNPNYYNGTIPWLKTGELNDGVVTDSAEKITELALKQCSLRLNKIGDVLIAMYGATIGKLGIAGIELTTNQACCGCTPYSFINNEFLFYYLISLKPYFLKIAFGGAQPNISKDKIQNTYIGVPPLKTQKRIVSQIKQLIKTINLVDNNFSDVCKLTECTKRKVLDEIFSENSSYKSYYPNKVELGNVLAYEQPGPFIVVSTEYDDSYMTPVLTAGKSFILGYTNEKDGIYHVKDKVIIFDDFTTASRLIDFDFKVKSSAMKILRVTDNRKFNIDYLYYLLQTIHFLSDTHKRFWISEYAPLQLKIHTLDDQMKIVNAIKTAFSILDNISK